MGDLASGKGSIQNRLVPGGWLRFGAGMIRLAEGCKSGSTGFLTALGGAMALLCFTTPVLAGEKSDPYAFTVFAGKGTDTDFFSALTQPWTIHFVDLGIVGAAVSARVGTVNELTGWDLGSIGDDFSIDLETGAAYRFGDECGDECGDEEMGEFWGAIYLRYDGFPWNDTIYTTIAANTGVSYITHTSEFEKGRSDGQSSQLMHYLTPEITFADPDDKNVEWLVQLHHRSGVFGLFDGASGGSTFVTTGLRVHFQ